MQILFIVLLILSVAISGLAQVLLKKATQKNYRTIWMQYINPNTICGYSIFLFVVFFTSVAMRFVPLTVVNILAESLTFVFAIIFGRIFFKEKITKKKIVGSIFIIIGIVFIICI